MSDRIEPPSDSVQDRWREDYNSETRRSRASEPPFINHEQNAHYVIEQAILLAHMFPLALRDLRTAVAFYEADSTRRNPLEAPSVNATQEGSTFVIEFNRQGEVWERFRITAAEAAHLREQLTPR
jgi:hypothetical protein